MSKGKKVIMSILGLLPGIITAVVLAVIVWLFTHYNLFILLAAFIAGDFVVGITAEFLLVNLKVENDVKNAAKDSKADVSGKQVSKALKKGIKVSTDKAYYKRQAADSREQVQTADGKTASLAANSIKEKKYKVMHI